MKPEKLKEWNSFVDGFYAGMRYRLSAVEIDDEELNTDVTEPRLVNVDDLQAVAKRLIALERIVTDAQHQAIEQLRVDMDKLERRFAEHQHTTRFPIGLTDPDRHGLLDLKTSKPVEG